MTVDYNSLPKLDRDMTAKDFLLWLVNSVLGAEPARLDMGIWRAFAGKITVFILKEVFPPCGTIACLGGWTEIVLRLDGNTNSNPWCNTQSAPVGGRLTAAGIALGLNITQQFELFWPYDLQGAKRLSDMSLEDVKEHVNAFITKYDDQLSTHIVKAPVQS